MLKTIGNISIFCQKNVPTFTQHEISHSPTPNKSNYYFFENQHPTLQLLFLKMAFSSKHTNIAKMVYKL